ncbi:tetratricopeptide repeat protein [Candidatus Microgenomates bacterium]|nr:tetratricopeptide repeat protein [Candidatus Microgenomates bacterium]
MHDETTAAAIDAALKCNWAAAVAANAKILKATPCDIDCLNRLGRAYLELGDQKRAATYFRKVLKIDRYNPIAQKNLSRAQDPKQNTKTKMSHASSNSSAASGNFLEEPGKTRLIALVNVAAAGVLLKQNHADVVHLVPKRHTIVVEDSEGNYLGALPDDLGHRLSVLIKGGNQYEAVTKSVAKNSLVVFLREICRSKKFHNTPSFLAGTTPDYLSYLREDTSPSSEVSESETDGEEGDTPSTKLHQDEEPETT